MHRCWDIRRWLDEVEERLKDAAAGIAPEKARERAHYMKAQMPMLGLGVPRQRAVAKGYGFTDWPLKEQLPVWDFIWKNARTHEGKCQPLYYLMALKERDWQMLWPVLRGWPSSVNCWDQSDYLSKLINEFFTEQPDAAQPVLEEWAEDENPWLRRIAIVALFGFGGKKERYPAAETVLRLVQARLFDEAYYVQKGVGWCLRECFLVYPDITLAFLKNHAGDIAPAAWQAATEKLTREEKAAVKALRRRK